MSFADDLAALYSALGQQVTLRRAVDGSETTGWAILDLPGTTALGGQVLTTETMLRYPAATFPAVARGDEIRAGAVTYVARQAAQAASPDGLEHAVPLALAPSLNIDPRRVLLIVNDAADAHGAQSRADADDYVLRRGLDPQHRLGFAYDPAAPAIAFGAHPVCASSPGGTLNGLSVVESVGAYIIEHGIEMVILSTHTPGTDTIGIPIATHMGWTPGLHLLGRTQYTTGPGYLPGDAPWWNDGTAVGPPFYSLVAWDWGHLIAPHPNRASNGITSPDRPDTVPSAWRASLDAAVPYQYVIATGRLGLPDIRISGDHGQAATLDEAQLESGLLRNAYGSIYNCAVTRALEAEGQDNRGRLIYVPQRTADYVNFYGFRAEDAAAMVPMLQAEGCRAVQAATQAEHSAWLARTDTRHRALFGFAGIAQGLPGGFQYCVADPAPDAAYSFLPGAWAHDDVSSGGETACRALQHGASAACGWFREPIATGIPIIRAMLYPLLRNKMSIGQAAWHCALNKKHWTTFGDPLYRPYRT